MKQLPSEIGFAVLLGLLMSTTAWAGRQVSGVQIGVWSVAHSPYLVIEDIIVPKGLVLKIDPGVVVKFAGKYQISVEGALIAKGSEARPIIFTSVNDIDVAEGSYGRSRPARPADWHGIEFRQDCDDYASALDHCVIRFSDWGIRCLDCFPQLTNITLQFSEQMTLVINNELVPFLPGHRIHPLSQQNRPVILPLPEPAAEISNRSKQKFNPPPAQQAKSPCPQH